MTNSLGSKRLHVCEISREAIAHTWPAFGGFLAHSCTILDTIETTGGKLQKELIKCPLNFMLKCGSSKERGLYSLKNMQKKTELGNSDFAVIFLAHKSRNNE